MADKATQLLLDGLSRAVADPAGAPLFATRTAPGLFAATGPGRQVAQRCKDEGLLRVVRTDTSGRSPVEVCALTEKGLAYLLSQASPRQVLEDLVRAVELRQSQAAELLAVARQMQSSLDGLKTAAERVLDGLGKPTPPPPAPNGCDTWLAEALSLLRRRHDAGTADDCPLPELYRHVQPHAPRLTVGQFHDGLRRLHAEGRVYLHPWTGPLYDLPEPSFALLVGHEVAYYASIRMSGPEIGHQ
jgi:hypothetical protein